MSKEDAETQDYSFTMHMDVNSKANLDVGNPASDLVLDFPNRFHVRQFQLISAVIPSTEYTIDNQTKDFRLKIKKGGGNWVEVEPPSSYSGGNETATSLVPLLGSWLGTADGAVTWVVEYDPRTKKFTFEGTEEGMTSLELAVSDNLSYENQRRVEDILGLHPHESLVFEEDVVADTFIATAPRVAYLDTGAYYYIQCPELNTDTFHTGFYSTTIIAAIPIYFGNANDIIYETMHRAHFRYRLQTAQRLYTLSFRLIDAWGRPVDMRGRHYSMRLAFQMDPYKDPYTSGDYYYNAGRD